MFYLVIKNLTLLQSWESGSIGLHKLFTHGPGRVALTLRALFEGVFLCVVSGADMLTGHPNRLPRSLTVISGVLSPERHAKTAGGLNITVKISVSRERLNKMAHKLQIFICINIWKLHIRFLPLLLRSNHYILAYGRNLKKAYIYGCGFECEKPSRNVNIFGKAVGCDYYSSTADS